MKVRWLPPIGGGIDADAEERFTLADARRMMARSSGGKLRVVSVGRVQYMVRQGESWKSKNIADEYFLFIQGRWEPKTSSSQSHDDLTEASSVMEFVVSIGVVDDRWKT